MRDLALTAMLVPAFLLSFLAQAAGSLGLAWAVSRLAGARLPGSGAFRAAAAFGLAGIAESLFLAGISCAGLLRAPLPQAWFALKLVLAVAAACDGPARRAVLAWLSGRKLLACWAGLLALACSLPTSCYDAFTAHFAVARLFITECGLPNRPDYQYLDALPLGAHMWSVPGLSLGLEGAANAVSPLFSLACLVLVDGAWGRRTAFFSLLLVLSMPEFVRLSLDPMVDLPCVFYALLGLAHLRACRRGGEAAHLAAGGLSWAMLLAVKQSLLAFPLAWAAFALAALLRRRVSFSAVLPAALAVALVGGFWYVKTWAVTGNPFHPYFLSAGAQPLIPPGHRPPGLGLSAASLLAYLRVVFLDPRWPLSLGPWPLALLPLLAWAAVRGRRRLLAISLLVFLAGFLVTWHFMPFKNRYLLPYALLLLPWMAAFLGRRAGPARLLLAATALFSCASFLPYFLQPLGVLAKGLDREAYYATKFDNYAAIRRLDTLPPGRVLFAATPVYWITREHVLSVYSETHVDYTRLRDLPEFRARLAGLHIRYVAYDRRMISAMAGWEDPWYRAKRYAAGRALGLLDALAASPDVRVLWDEQGFRVLEILQAK